MRDVCAKCNISHHLGDNEAQQKTHQRKISSHSLSLPDHTPQPFLKPQSKKMISTITQVPANVCYWTRVPVLLVQWSCCERQGVCNTNKKCLLQLSSENKTAQVTNTHASYFITSILPNSRLKGEIFLFKHSGFTMLCHFLLYSKVIRSRVYIFTCFF